MSVAYFVTAVDPTAWKYSNIPIPKPTSELFVDPTVYQTELLTRWPDANVHTSSDSLVLLYWTLYGDGVEGMLHRDHQSVSFHAGAGLVEFVMWHRTFVSAKFPLYLFRDSSWDTMELQAGITEQNIVDFLGFNL